MRIRDIIVNEDEEEYKKLLERFTEEELDEIAEKGLAFLG